VSDKSRFLDEVSERPLVTRSQARAARLTKYFSGSTCKHGHITERWTANGNCDGCKLVATADTRRLDNRRRYATLWAKQHRSALKAAASTGDLSAIAELEQWLVKLASKKRARRAANPEPHRKEVRIWIDANLDQHRAHMRNRRARVKAASGIHNAEDIADILRLQRGRCALPTCRSKIGKKYHVDHIIALVNGGGNGRRNLQIMCPRCNLRKHAKDQTVFMREIGMLI
jgi:5-methylcytosine-specific restriction endonuclease McrA